MDIVNANIQHFDKQATMEEDDSVHLVAEQVANQLRKLYEFDPQNTFLLDYASGSGSLSRNLAASTRQILGADISQGVVDNYNRISKDRGFSPDKLKAVHVQPFIPTDAPDGGVTEAAKQLEDVLKLDGRKFDVVVCANAYHHVPDIDLVTKLLVSVLKPETGRLFVVDLSNYERPDDHDRLHNHGQEDHGHGHGHGHGDHPPSAGHTHGTHGPAPFSGPAVAHTGGFVSSRIESCFTNAGLCDFNFVDAAATAEFRGGQATFFLASGRRERGSPHSSAL